MMHICNPRTWKADEEDGEFKATLGNFLKKKRKETELPKFEFV
jgi:hypothetical protein